MYSGYAYGSATEPGLRPHAVRAVTAHTEQGSQTLSYTYDANGNLIQGGGNSLTWASYNKPVQITDTASGYSSAFAYGPDRARYWQYAQTQTGPATTWYVGTAYERVTDASGTQHRFFIRAGGQVIAVHKVQEAASPTPFASSGASLTPSPSMGEGRGEGELSTSSAPFAKGAASGTAAGGGFSALALADPDANGIWTEYLHRDHQGSIVAITSETGELLARFRYDAWGQRQAVVNLNETTDLFTTLTAFTTRGYTGHEHLQHVGLIHMNGRVYDPAIGRFLSADPFVQYIVSTQSWNRYTYVNNNPLSYTDPSGYFSWSKFRDKWLKPVVAIVAAVITYGAVSGYLASAGWTTFWASVGAGATAGFVGGGIATGTLEGAFKGAVTGAIFGGINGYYQEHWRWSRVFANSTAGGISSEIAGGQFKDGFKFTFVISVGAYAASSMRESMIKQSKLDPRNASGKSAGFKGDGFKLGGGRAPADIFEELTPSPLGGVQGGQGELFGIEYSPDSITDLVVEAYAGPHDWLNSWYWYDDFGNIRLGMSTAGKIFGEVLNFANVAIATPIVASSVIPSYTYGVFLYEHERKRENGQ